MTTNCTNITSDELNYTPLVHCLAGYHQIQYHSVRFHLVHDHVRLQLVHATSIRAAADNPRLAPVYSLSHTLLHVFDECIMKLVSHCTSNISKASTYPSRSCRRNRGFCHSNDWREKRSCMIIEQQT